MNNTKIKKGKPKIVDIEEVYQKWILGDPEGTYTLSAFEFFRYLNANFDGLVQKGLKNDKG